MNGAKDYLTPKTFGNLAYVSSIVHILCGITFTSIVLALNERETGQFTCNIPPDSTAVYKTQIDKACFLSYQQKYNTLMPFSWFVILSIWFPIIVAVVYSLWVRRRVDQINSSNHELQTEAESDFNPVQNTRTLFIFYFYLFHLAIRILSGLVFTILQHTVIFPSGFDLEFTCSLPPTRAKTAQNVDTFQLNGNTPITCENSVAHEKQLCWIIVSIFNTGFALIMLVEMIRLCRRFPIKCKRRFDWSFTEFVKFYLVEKQYSWTLPIKHELENCIDFYKEQVLHAPRGSSNFYYTELVIHTERAKHRFSKSMDRHEMFDVYMKVPETSTRLKEVHDLFYSNKDTDENFPRTILVIGRPGIGKTVLTEKIMRDWANARGDEFYRGKIAFYFKSRWFCQEELQNITLKKFLQYGTELNDEKFESIYESITIHPEKAILIFDGLDEINTNVDSLEYLPHLNDPNICMSAVSLFVKVVSGRLLRQATVLVTSRPTANEYYSRFTFDKTVEIIGFTSDKIEEYVRKFCDNHKRSDLGPKIWKHIKSSSELLNLCYIPVNCFIVSTMFFDCLRDPGNETSALPTTLTELYNEVISHFDQRRNREVDEQSSKDAMKNLRRLAYNKIVHGRQVFDNELCDKQMKRSGLLNSLSNPYSQAQTQFCFIHLTIQEFLAAKHVTDIFTPEQIKEFIVSNVKSGKWFLVLHFIAGLLGKKNCHVDCVLAFTQDLNVKDGIFDVAENSLLFVMKCLKEVNDEDIVKDVCNKSVMNDVVELTNTGKGGLYLTSSDWAAVAFVYKYMKKLTRLNLHLSNISEECYLEVDKLLQKRCIKQLNLMGSLNNDVEVGLLCESLMESNCVLEHEHSKLTELNILHFNVTINGLSNICASFQNGHASCLEKLVLRNCRIDQRGVSKLCEVLDHQLCPELTYLELSRNSISDDGAVALFNALIGQKLCNLTHLFLHCCSLTSKCIPSLCKLLEDKRCNLTVLSLEGNKGIGDEGLQILCEGALTREQCKLAELYLAACSLTDKSIPVLCKALQNRSGNLSILSMKWNKDISDEGLRVICERALTKEHCKLTKLLLQWCSLTDECIPELSKALQDKLCVLNELWLGGNKITKDGKKSLRQIQENKHCCCILKV